MTTTLPAFPRPAVRPHATPTSTGIEPTALAVDADRGATAREFEHQLDAAVQRRAAQERAGQDRAVRDRAARDRSDGSRRDRLRDEEATQARGSETPEVRRPVTREQDEPVDRHTDDRADATTPSPEAAALAAATAERADHTPPAEATPAEPSAEPAVAEAAGAVGAADAAADTAASATDAAHDVGAGSSLVSDPAGSAVEPRPSATDATGLGSGASAAAADGDALTGTAAAGDTPDGQTVAATATSDTFLAADAEAATPAVGDHGAEASVRSAPSVDTPTPDPVALAGAEEADDVTGPHGANRATGETARPDLASAVPGAPSTDTSAAAAAPTASPGARAAAPASPQAPVDLAAPAARGVELSELGERLGASLRRNVKFQSLSLQLHPAELGAVRVEARLVDGVTHLVISPDSAHGGDRLAGALRELRHDLARAGVDVGDLDLRQGGAESSSAGQSDRDTRTGQSGSPGTTSGVRTSSTSRLDPIAGAATGPTPTPNGATLAVNL